MADLPIDLPAELAEHLGRALDPDGKIVRALDALGPIADRDVALVGGGPRRAADLATAGARVTEVDLADPNGSAAGPTFDAIVSFWSAFRGLDPADLAGARRILRPGGRLLVVHDYGRDDVSRLRGDRPEYAEWSRRDGPYLRGGFRIRVLHAFWTFESLDAQTAFLEAAFGDAGRAIAETLKRPRLSYNVAIYHRSFSEGDNPA